MKVTKKDYLRAWIVFLTYVFLLSFLMAHNPNWAYVFLAGTWAGVVSYELRIKR